ncbi:leucine efflux protein LeuE [Nocardioides sp. zg-1228]|uniref:leucine efflux protein LeuE n=1 Tax=Nocardioides sp. zg-1228 TaxID=2763008 RepID=UPI001642C53D|nr:leucine efflux protein LeuE [Nocardioides sp. zg-1228]MBC2932156.1 leucine efflux protein LeuE [Nocardioides sp. zg-1228]QSF57694.1 leucine efflux protein LeuE [Nocardioides sp. zg-1228]
MLGITDLPTYLVGLILIILLPGPNSIYILSVAARRGVRSGYAGAAGVWTGDAVLMTLSAAGVASLLQANPAAFAVVKWAGASYLLWLAIGMLRTGWTTWRSRVPVAEQIADAAQEAGVEPQGRGERPYRRALVISLLNPKAILFFVAFFVQFVDPAYPHPVVSFLVLGSLATLASATYLSVLIFAGNHLAAAFRRRRALSAGATSAVGAVFVGFAVKLALASA